MHTSALRHLLVVSCACLAVALATPRTIGKEAAPPRSSEDWSCPGKILSPLAVSIDADEAALRPGVPAHLSVTITSTDDVASLTARVLGEGPIGIEGPSVVDVGSLAAGDARSFEVAVRPDGTGRSAVHLVLEGVDFDGRPVAGRRGSLFLLVRPGDTLAATSDFQDLDLRAIRVDQEAGRLTPVEAEAARLAIAETPARHDLEPPAAREPSPEEMELNLLIGAPLEGPALSA
ncbi:MAG TPA: hypothetical protein VMQ62_06050, partial [Dongiaceae bacterium]|nr:hypothetical protein [Dongiaceae bacterium]